MRKRSNEQPHVIKPFLPPAIPPRASAHPSHSLKIRSHLPQPEYDLADIDTVPPTTNADISAQDTVEQASYRQDSGKHVSNTYTQYRTEAKKSSKQPVTSSLRSEERLRNPFLLNPLEGVRWWLLYPGRIEFLLWCGGTLFLLVITIMLVLVTMLSLRIFD
jgi:hypothetical protein